MKLLIFGGTQFLGYYIAELALDRGHEVTLFNRGISNPDAFPEAEHLRGDRDGDLEPLVGRSFDRVIDATAFVPRNVRRTVEVLGDSLQHYTYISSTRVYELTGPTFSETSPRVVPPPEPTLEFPRDKTLMTPLCEEEFERSFADRLLTVRPGFIIGPRDITDRFTYWPRRVAEGGDIVVPGPPDRLLQLVDARDTAAFILDLAERAEGGIFNVVGPQRTMEEILDVCCRVTGRDPNFVWVDDDFLLEEGVEPWTEMTCWRPGPIGRRGWDVNGDKAIAAGLTVRPFEDSVRDTYEWDAARARPLPRGKTGSKYWVTTLKPERELELLEHWRRRSDDRASAPAR